MKKVSFLLAVACVALSSCCNKTACCSPDYSDSTCWVQTGEEINPDYVDVFWFSGTLFQEQKDENGNQTHRIIMDEEQRLKYCKAALASAHTLLFPDSLNFFSPCFHQFTLDLIDEPQSVFDSLTNVVADEAYAMFHYYMENMNNGRPYILAGMSQGGLMVKSVLQRMTDEEYSRMKVAYCMGFGLSAEDLKCKHIVPATGELDKGVTVSYNSVADVNGIWDVVRNNAVACINPANWKTDSTAADVEFMGMKLKTHIDPAYNLIFVDNIDFSKMPVAEGFEKYPWFKTNLHVIDIPLYAPFIKRNALDRAYK